MVFTPTEYLSFQVIRDMGILLPAEPVKSVIGRDAENLRDLLALSVRTAFWG
jgi:hypothetical protein